MSGHALPNAACAKVAAPTFRRVAVSGWMTVFGRLFRTIEERRILATLDDRMLADIGLNRLEAERETARAPWDTRRQG